MSIKQPGRSVAAPHPNSVEFTTLIRSPILFGELFGQIVWKKFGAVSHVRSRAATLLTYVLYWIFIYTLLYKLCSYMEDAWHVYGFIASLVVSRCQWRKVVGHFSIDKDIIYYFLYLRLLSHPGNFWSYIIWSQKWFHLEKSELCYRNIPRYILRVFYNKKHFTSTFIKQFTKYYNFSNSQVCLIEMDTFLSSTFLNVWT